MSREKERVRCRKLETGAGHGDELAERPESLGYKKREVCKMVKKMLEIGGMAPGMREAHVNDAAGKAFPCSENSRGEEARL